MGRLLVGRTLSNFAWNTDFGVGQTVSGFLLTHSRVGPTISSLPNVKVMGAGY